jgi:hypothetical protein
VAYGRQAGATSLKVPLHTAHPDGELLEGLIKVPPRLAHAEPDTNEKHEFDALIREGLKRWCDWREKRGWTLNSTPKIRGPFNPPTRTEKDEANPDEFWYFAIARFQRTGPAFIRLDDLLEIQDSAARYGIDLDADGKPWNDIAGDGDTGWGDPMKFAEERRQKLGIKRKDYLYGPLGAPKVDPR